MRLVDLIRDHRDIIIRNWSDFAATIDPDGELSDFALRDHAAEILDAIVKDMLTPQSDGEQTAKSKGRGAANVMSAVSTAHTNLRIGSGFRIDQIVSEYRALRASVMRLWEKQEPGEVDTLHEVTRFNEAIDSAITEAVLRYTKALAQFRDQSLALLGHDLRTPLTAVSLFAQMQLKSQGVDARLARLASRILDSTGRMNRLVSELVDVSQTWLGGGLTCTIAPMDLAEAFKQLLARLEYSYPHCVVRLEANGDLHGEWDTDRVAQLIWSLASNAIQSGDGKPISVIAHDEGAHVVVDIHNESVIPPHARGAVFEPFVHAAADVAHTDSTSRGLALYLSRQIVAAHGGTIEVTSTRKAGTTFHVRLPRHQAPIEPAHARSRAKRDAEASATTMH